MPGLLWRRAGEGMRLQTVFAAGVEQRVELCKWWAKRAPCPRRVQPAHLRG